MGQLIVGTYTEALPHVDGHGLGLVGIAVDEHGHAGSHAELLAVCPNPSYVVPTNDCRYVYVVHETSTFGGEDGGGVSAYRRDPVDGALTLVNSRSSGGAFPCHLALSEDEAFVLVANYGGGSIAVFGRHDDGSLGPRTDRIEHSGAPGGALEGQRSPHPHMVCPDPATGLVLVADKGLDAVLTYQLTPTGHLVELEDRRISLPSWPGPRHLAFHPDGAYMFVVSELDNTVLAYRRTKEAFVLTSVAPTLSNVNSGSSYAAALRVLPSGRHILVSNRGNNSLALLGFDTGEGCLRLLSETATNGATPRDMCLIGKRPYLAVTNQDSDSVALFAVDEHIPCLAPRGETFVASPACAVHVA